MTWEVIGYGGNYCYCLAKYVHVLSVYVYVHRVVLLSTSDILTGSWFLFFPLASQAPLEGQFICASCYSQVS